MKRLMTLVGIFASVLTLSAADPSDGTWKKKSSTPVPGMPAGDVILVVEAGSGQGKHLIWKIKSADGKETLLMSLDTALDGAQTPVIGADGKPNGQTMGIKRLDERHSIAVVLMGGKPFGTSKSEISADGRTMTVVSDMTSAGGSAVTEIWEKQ
jgi:hypothetical protein